MAFFFIFFCFALTCNIFDGMKASVLMKVNVLIWSLLKEKRWDPVRFSATPLSQYIKWLSPYYMSDHVYLCSFNIPYISSFFLCREFRPGGCFVALLNISYHNRKSYNIVPYY
jgi:hypothetical protein